MMTINKAVFTYGNKAKVEPTSKKEARRNDEKSK